ncbi:MAG TPA: hypothetical protein VIN09_02920 [Chloroflexota bacterium]
MTVCIGALCASPDGRESGAAVVAADRMVTLGRITEFEHDVPKITTVADRVVALTSGDALRGAELARALVASLPSGDRALETVARVAVERYVELRRRQVEVEVFTPRGITMADFYGGLQQRFVPPLAGSIDQQVTSFNYGADLLIAGVDEHGAHLYHVHHPGDLSDFARIGFHAIGTGALHALHAMIGFGHTPRRPLREAVFSVYAAKRQAEVAPGVGEDTDMAVILDTGVKFLAQSVLDRLDDLYRAYQRPILREVEEKIAELRLFDEEEPPRATPSRRRRPRARRAVGGPAPR